MDLLGWDGKGEDMLSGQETSLSGRFAQQRKLRSMTREATLMDVANSELRCLLSNSKSFNRADAKMGDSEVF